MKRYFVVPPGESLNMRINFVNGALLMTNMLNSDARLKLNVQHNKQLDVTSQQTAITPFVHHEVLRLRIR
ncbi:6747_t:CDS:2 [Funneliformis mosseae]|uniref:6747_t:CDS:1 n=1 Tax=Funneliformis mosseae TaxID=27381 RepID=A0A9N8WRH2_FUNMO|nr:6747_t:CDS:2 [Funneliformis mosseae]